MGKGNESYWPPLARTNISTDDEVKSFPSSAKLRRKKQPSRSATRPHIHRLTHVFAISFACLCLLCWFAPQVMARYFWKNLSPWLEEDVRKTLDRPDVEIFRSEPYVGFHIRRGDKVSEGEAAKVETRVR